MYNTHNKLTDYNLTIFKKNYEVQVVVVIVVVVVVVVVVVDVDVVQPPSATPANENIPSNNAPIKKNLFIK